MNENEQRNDEEKRTGAPEERSVPKIIWFLAIHAGIGIAAGIALAALVILTNVASIKTMLHESADPFIPMLLLYFGFAVTFGSAAMGIAIMTLPYPPPPKDQ